METKIARAGFVDPLTAHPNPLGFGVAAPETKIARDGFVDPLTVQPNPPGFGVAAPETKIARAGFAGAGACKSAGFQTAPFAATVNDSEQLQRVNSGKVV